MQPRLVSTALLVLVPAVGVSSAADDGAPVAVEAEFILDAMRVFSGGKCPGHGVPSLARVGVTVDAGRAWGWKGATLHGSVMRLGGSTPGFHAADAQGLSNIDGPNAWWVHQAWVDQRLAGGAGSIRAGLYDLATEFDVIETASLFLGSSHGTGPEFSQSGPNGPSIFPYTGLGLRGRAALGSAWAQVALMEGVPGDPGGDGGTTIRFHRDEGMLIVAEAGTAGPRSRKAAGLWGYTRGSTRSGGAGLYAFLEGKVRERDDGRAVDGWVRVGVADPRAGRFGRYAGGGLVWHGLIPGRARDALGVALAHATNGATYLAERRGQGIEADSSETAVELTYRVHVNDWLSLQPDLQWIRNPGTDPTRSDALAVGVRAHVAF